MYIYSFSFIFIFVFIAIPIEIAIWGYVSFSITSTVSEPCPALHQGSLIRASEAFPKLMHGCHRCPVISFGLRQLRQLRNAIPLRGCANVPVKQHSLFTTDSNFEAGGVVYRFFPVSADREILKLQGPQSKDEMFYIVLDRNYRAVVVMLAWAINFSSLGCL